MKNFAALISLAVVFSGAFALSTQSVNAKTAQSNASKSKNFFVPPPPPYVPSVGPSVLGILNAQAVAANANEAILGNSLDLTGKHSFAHDRSGTSQFVQTTSGVTFSPAVETKIQQHIDDFDSEISNSQKEIGKLLNL